MYYAAELLITSQQTLFLEQTDHIVLHTLWTQVSEAAVDGGWPGVDGVRLRRLHTLPLESLAGQEVHRAHDWTSGEENVLTRSTQKLTYNCPKNVCDYLLIMTILISSPRLKMTFGYFIRYILWLSVIVVIVTNLPWSRQSRNHPISTVQSEASGCKKGFAECFINVPQAVGILQLPCCPSKQ